MPRTPPPAPERPVYGPGIGAGAGALRRRRRRAAALSPELSVYAPPSESVEISLGTPSLPMPPPRLPPGADDESTSLQLDESTSLDAAAESLSLELEEPTSLNIALGEFDQSHRDILGLVCKTQAEDTVTLRACLRSGVEGGFIDAFFGKRVVSYHSTSTHADLIKLEERDDIPPQAPWRELVLFFPPDLRQLQLIDLRLFGV